MCFGGPDIPPPPPPPQDTKQPETTALKKKRTPSTQGGTLLTSPSGVAGQALNTGAPTLLGG